MEYIFILEDDWNGILAYCSSFDKAKELALDYYGIQEYEEAYGRCSITRERIDTIY